VQSDVSLTLNMTGQQGYGNFSNFKFEKCRGNQKQLFKKRRVTAVRRFWKRATPFIFAERRRSPYYLTKITHKVMTFSSLHCYRSVTILCLMGWFLFNSVLGWGQTCGTPPPTAAEMQQRIAQVAGVVVGGTAKTYNIPVKIFLIRSNNGSEWPMPQIQNDIDQALVTMNQKLNIGTANPPVTLTNTFNFFRCGPINIVNSTYLHTSNNTIVGSSGPLDFLYETGMMNMYIFNSSAVIPPVAHNVQSVVKTIHMALGPEITSGNFFHELGHTVGLLHTFEGLTSESPYNNPAVTGTGFIARELVIRSLAAGVGKSFPRPNYWTAGDYVEDTPAACGNLDGNSSCKQDGNCNYTGNYRDRNGDFISDPTNILIKNYMGYVGGGCRNEFTLGQRKKADTLACTILKPFFDQNFDYCYGSLKATDKVEIEGTSTALDRVRLLFYDELLDPNPIINIIERKFSRTINEKGTGQFSVRLFPRLNQAQTGRLQYANIVRHRLNDVTQFDNDWSVGVDVSTLDITAMSRHMLGIESLANGYKMIAADVNRNNTITNFDIVEIQRLINGIYTALPGFQSPWRFIPETVTQNPSGSIHNNFNGGVQYEDNPFSTTAQGFGTTLFDPNTYCNNEWGVATPWLYTVSNNQNGRGFDAVRMGNAEGNTTVNFGDGVVTSERTKKEDCEGDVVMVVPKTSIKAGETVQLIVRGYEFKDVSAIQMGMRASKEDFEYVKIETSTLDNFLEENCLGGLNIGNDNLKLVWVDNKINAKNLKNRDALFTITLKAKRSITDLSTVFYLDDEVLETYFLSFKSGCKKDVSLEIEVKIPQRLDQGAEERGDIEAPVALRCVPNPASSTANLIFDAQTDFEGNIAIQDNFGKVVKTLPYTFRAGRNIIAIPDFSELPVGVLAITVKDAQQQHTVRVIKY
jgi:hypothetical protein